MPTQHAARGTEVLVAFASRHGGTRGVAERIAARLDDEGLVVTLGAVEDVTEIPPGAAVVLGSPVYDGRWPPEFDAFVERHLRTLVSRPVWLFSVGTFGDTRRAIGALMLREPRNIADVRDALRPRDYRVFAGVILRHQWPPPSRLLFHAFGGRFGDNRDWPAIEGWAEAIARELTRSPEPAETR